MFAITIKLKDTILNPDTVTFQIYKNGVATGLVVLLDSTTGDSATLYNVGVTFLPTDTIDVRRKSRCRHIYRKYSDILVANFIQVIIFFV